MGEENKEESPQLCNAFLDLNERLYYELLIKRGKEVANEEIENIIDILIKEMPGFVKHLEIRMNDKENVSPLRFLNKFSYLLEEIKE